jgi:uncharacterized protein YjeT (DUF2065 family)
LSYEEMLMRAALIWTVNLVLVVNGGAMLVFPETWFGLIPSVADTGPFNPHFVRDVGSAYLVAGGGLIWFWLDKRARPAAVAGAAFLALHALVHVWDAAAGRESLVHFLEDVPVVVLPGLLVFKLARRRATSSEEKGYAEMVDRAAPRRV